jgi:hypothetical protein
LIRLKKAIWPAGTERFEVVDGVAVGTRRFDAGQVGSRRASQYAWLAGLQQMRLAGTRFAPEQEQRLAVVGASQSASPVSASALLPVTKLSRLGGASWQQVEDQLAHGAAFRLSALGAAIKTRRAISDKIRDSGDR